ncbi:nucleoside/nucleotide kinase family protein [Faecalimonas sp.]
MGKIFYVMGKSSSGKDTIFKKLQECLPELKTIVLYTTRPIREGEKDGVEYYFVSEKELEIFQESGKIIELRAYDTVHGQWNYFTVADDQIQLEMNNYIIIGTLVSYEKMQEYFGEENLVPVYIEVEDGERLARALEREQRQENPKYAELCRRFLADTKDFSEENLEKLGIKKRFHNENVDTCVEEIVLYIREKL